jgi:predicted anti-sigma-YlaC factor YlaD
MNMKEKEVVCRDVVELATDYLEGALLEPLKSLLEEHLEECDGCVEYLEQLQQTVGVLRSLGGEQSFERKAWEELKEIFRRWAATPRSD